MISEGAARSAAASFSSRRVKWNSATSSPEESSTAVMGMFPAGTALSRSIRTRTSLHSFSEERIWTSEASGSSESRTRMSAMGEAFSRMRGAMRSSSGRRAVMSGSQSLRE